MNATHPAACSVIRDEHRTLAALLHALRYLVRELRAEHIRPDFKLMRAIIYYIDAYPDRLHHPKEELHLFAALAKRTREADDDLRILREEHANGARLIRDLGHELLRYELGGDTWFPMFAAAVEAYASFYYQHMEREESRILPLAMQHLTAEDWQAINRAFSENDDPLKGADEREFRELFSTIVNIAPPPIGVGASAAIN